MKAVRIHRYGGLDVLRYEDAPTPEIGPTEVLIKVRAASVNPVDWKIRRGMLKNFLPHALPLTLGWDVAGTVEKVGGLVTRFKVGDAVYSRPDISRNGTYAEYVAVRAHEIGHAPKSIPLEQAAGIPLAGLTAWMALFDKANLQAGQSVLIHAGAGGVGSFAVQFARLAGARVIATASAGNAELVRSLGADEVIDYRAEDFSRRVQNLDAVFDTVGGETLAKSWGVLRKGGVLVSIIAPLERAQAERYGVRAEYLFIAPSGAHLDNIAGLVDAGRVRVAIAKEFPLDQAQAAHELSETGHAHGKIILRVS